MKYSEHNSYVSSVNILSAQMQTNSSHANNAGDYSL